MVYAQNVLRFRNQWIEYLFLNWLYLNFGEKSSFVNSVIGLSTDPF
jgi:hypothetical protein